MRKLFLFFNIFLFSYTFSQTNYVFNVELRDRNQLPTFNYSNGVLKYNGKNYIENIFFAKYNILRLYQTYPSSKVEKSLNIYTFETSSSDLMNDLLTNFPNKYLGSEDLTGQVIELLYYPNDYGDGSYNPISNSGANISLKNYDYINCPKAWDFFSTSNIGNVTIGISDGKVLNSDIDLIGKVEYINESSFNSNFSCSSEAAHGVSVGAIAAAKGNNNHGITGVCPDCKIVNTPYTLTYNGLLDLANAGVKVINMSWAFMYDNDETYVTGYVQSQQDIINQIHEMGVVLVAGAGNVSSYSAPPPRYLRYAYPASYNHVISVSSVNSKNENFTDELTGPIPTFGMVSWYNEDLISPTGAIDYNGNLYTSFYEGHTTNSKVDLCAPGFQYPVYARYLLGCPNLLGDGTSGSAPFVSGTVALMQSLNACLSPDEVEDILQLSSKNIESNPYNSYFIGKIGSGKLEAGDSVEFVHEMMSSNGNALIDGQDFWRFDFDLKHINNNLTISNQIFRDQNTSNFTAKNSIEVLANSDMKPNSSGFIDLNIDSDLLVCLPPSASEKKYSEKGIKSKLNAKSIRLYPNPNKGSFTITLSQNEIKILTVSVFDILGKQVYSEIVNKSNFDLSLPNLPAGMYLVKLSSNDINETLKFIKQ